MENTYRGVLLQISICDALGNLVPFAQFRKRENTHGEVLCLVKLQTEACSFTKRDTSPWVFFTFFKLNKWYQFAQSSTYINQSIALQSKSIDWFLCEGNIDLNSF